MGYTMNKHKTRNEIKESAYEKLVAAFLVSGLVMTGVGVNHAEAASGNTIQTVQQLTQGEKSLENITLGESIKNVSNKYGTPIYSKNPSNNEGYYEYRTNKGLLVVTAVGKRTKVMLLEFL